MKKGQLKNCKLDFNFYLFAKLIFIIVSSFFFCNSFAHSTKLKQPNIVFLLLDDMGYGECGFNGGKEIKTPKIDQLAKDGAVLENNYVQPVCSPTRACLLTGRYPTHLIDKEVCEIIETSNRSKPLFYMCHLTEFIVPIKFLIIT